MKNRNKKTLLKRGIVTAGRAQNAAGAQVHADKRRAPRPLEKQRLKREYQHETARSRGPFLHLGVPIGSSNSSLTDKPLRGRICCVLVSIPSLQVAQIEFHPHWDCYPLAPHFLF